MPSIVSSAKRTSGRGLLTSTRSRKAPRMTEADDGPIISTWTDAAAASTATPTPTPTTDLFARIGEDAHCYILGYVLTVVEQPKEYQSGFGFFLKACMTRPEAEWHDWKTMSEEDRAPYERQYLEYKEHLGSLPMTKHNVSLVSRQWRDATEEVIDRAGAPPAQIIECAMFSELKAKIARLSLDKVQDQFIKAVKEEWGGVDWTHWYDCECKGCAEDRMACHMICSRSPLQVFVDTFCDGSFEIFGAICEKEYKRFLLVKCIETVAADDTSHNMAPNVHMWCVECLPTEVMRIFWQAHMLHPRMYYEDCRSLIGQIIDHDPNGSSVSIGSRSKHSYSSKKEALFAFEKQYPKSYYYGCPIPLGSTPYHTSIWHCLFEGEHAGFDEAIAIMVENIFTEMRSSCNESDSQSSW